MGSNDVILKPVKKSVSFDLNVIYIEHKNSEEDPESIPFTLNQFPGKYQMTDSEKVIAKKADKIKDQNTFDMVDEWSNITNQAIEKKYKYIFRMILEFYQKNVLIQVVLKRDPTKSNFLDVLSEFDKEYPGIYTYVTQNIITDI
jgi:hypothetical protein